MTLGEYLGTHILWELVKTTCAELKGAPRTGPVGVSFRSVNHTMANGLSCGVGCIQQLGRRR
jgi:hypothetical protein